MSGGLGMIGRVGIPRLARGKGGGVPAGFSGLRLNGNELRLNGRALIIRTQ